MAKKQQSKSYTQDEIVRIIDDTASNYGIDPTELLTIAYIESKFNPNAKARSSSAKGLFQFIKSTGKGYGLSGKEYFDPYENADAAARLYLSNKNSLRKALGREPTMGEMYLAHQQGAGGAIQILNSPSGASAINTLGYDQVALNVPRRKGESQKQFEMRIANMTMQDFGNLWIDKANNVAQTRLPPGYIGGGTPAERNMRDYAAGTAMGYAPGGASLTSFLKLPPRPLDPSASVAARHEATLRAPGAVNSMIPGVGNVPMPSYIPQQVQSSSAGRGNNSPSAPANAAAGLIPGLGTTLRPTPAAQAASNIGPVSQSDVNAMYGGIFPAQQTVNTPRAGLSMQQMQDMNRVGVSSYQLPIVPKKQPAAAAPTYPKVQDYSAKIPTTVATGMVPGVGGVNKAKATAGASGVSQLVPGKGDIQSASTRGGNVQGNTVYVRPNGTSVPAVTRTGTPTGRPSVMDTMFPATPAPKKEVKETRTVMKPTTVTTTIMVPNPAYKPGSVNPAAVNKLQGIHDKEDARIMAAQQSSIPKMIPKTVTQTVMKPVTITAPVPAAKPVIPVTKPASVQAKQDAASYAAANANAKAQAAANATRGTKSRMWTGSDVGSGVASSTNPLGI